MSAPSSPFVVAGLLALFAGFPRLGTAQFTDGLNVEFGKNRVQTRTFQWQYYEQGAFEIYHYQEGTQIAGQVARMLEEEAADLAPMFGRAIEGPIQVLVYKSQEEFRQSNVGVMAQSDQDSNIGGTAKLVGSKMFLHASGDRRQVRRDVREGLARILFQQTLYEGDWSQSLRSGNVIQTPVWMEEGVARYAARGLDGASMATVLDGCRRGRVTQLDHATGLEAAVLGQAVWAYVADVYGLPAVANVLYMTRITRSVEDGFRLATGMFLPDLMREVQSHHLRQAPRSYEDALPGWDTRKELRQARRSAGPDVPMTLRRRFEYQQFVPSPDGTTLAFTTNERGQRRVGTLDLATGDRTWHAVIGHRLDRLEDDLAPRLAWHPEGRLLAFSWEERGAPRMGLVDMATGEVERREMFKIDQVLSMTFTPDGNDLLMSALQDGSSDLYLYDLLSNSAVALWRDRFDDLAPAFWPDRDAFVFASNRPDDTLRNDRLNHPYPAALDLYVARLSDDPIRLERWTHTPDVDERFPLPLPDQQFVYLEEDSQGNQRVGFGWRDSVVVAVDTVVRYRPYTEIRRALTLPVPAMRLERTGPSFHATTRHAGQVHWWSVPDMPLASLKANPSAEVPTAAQSLDFPAVMPTWERAWADDEINPNDYVFEVERNREPGELPAADMQANREVDVTEWPALVPKNLRRNYALDKVQTQLNNTFGTTFYQPYQGQVNTQPGLGNASELRISDLMEDRHIVGGYTLPANLSNTFFGLAYINLEGQLDKSLSFQRQTSSRINPLNGQLVDTHAHVLRREWRWAFDEVRSLRWNATLRLDRDVIQGTDMFALMGDDVYGEQVGLQVAFVHDDTRSPRLNIRHGLRARVWAEWFVDGVGAQTATNPGGGLATPEDGWSFGTAGFDARRYIPLVGPSILALRVAGDWSLGQKKLLHILGGTDNSLSIASNAGTAVDPDIPYAYQARITPLRGFTSNVRNGSNVAVANAELRVPVFFNGTGRSEFFKNLQAIGFADVGSAWTGLHPYSDDNAFNFVTVESNPITVTVSNNRDPVLYDVGFGVRSRLFGYWVAADWAYGVDDQQVLPRRFTLSLNFDF